MSSISTWTTRLRFSALSPDAPVTTCDLLPEPTVLSPALTAAAAAAAAGGLGSLALSELDAVLALGITPVAPSSSGSCLSCRMRCVPAPTGDARGGIGVGVGVGIGCCCWCPTRCWASAILSAYRTRTVSAE